MMHKKGRSTRLLAAFLAFFMIISVLSGSVVFADENEDPDAQESSEYAETDTGNPPAATDPDPDPNPDGGDPPAVTDPDPDPNPDGGDPPAVTDPDPDPDPDGGDPPAVTDPDPDPDPDPDGGDLPEVTDPDPDPDPDPDEPENPDGAPADETEEEEDEEPADGETEELTLKEFEELLREFNNMRASDTVPDTMYVEPSSSNGVTERVYIDISRVTKTTSGSTYTFNVTSSLSLPAGANVSNCYFSWNSTLTASTRINNQNRTFSSGACPVPSMGQSRTYTFTRDKNGEKFVIKYAVTTDSVPTMMWIESSKNNGLSENAYIEISSTSGTTHTSYLILPFGAVVDEPEQLGSGKGCRFTWYGDLEATVSGGAYTGGTYASGACPVPAVGETLTYTFTNGSRQRVFVITAYAALPDTMWVKLSEEPEDPEQPADPDERERRVYIEQQSGTSYKLELPFGIPDNCCFVWNSDLSAAVDGVQYASSTCPIPQENATKSYTFSNGRDSVTFSVTTSVIEPKLRVEPLKEGSNGIPAKTEIDVFVSDTSTSGNTTTYTCGLYLPGSAVLDSCVLSWDGSIQATVDGESYDSGACPIPPVGETKTYTFVNGSKTWVYQITSYQGSVAAVFIEIDESKGTIAAMDNDPNHDTECTGQINIGGKWYDLSKMKGRGNATWQKADDKKPYNVTLGKSIAFPGISTSTKKWTFLAENFDKSLLSNRSGYWLANQLGIGQQTASADVWMNGEYQGCYTVTPKTDAFVTADGFMIEQDNNLEDPVPAGGDPQFTLEGMGEASGWSSCYNRITIKKIGDNLLNGDESVQNVVEVAGRIQTWLQEAWDAVRSNDGYVTLSDNTRRYYTQYIDLDSFARMYLLFEYAKSYDVCAGSILFYREGQTDADKLKAGPLWDLDNAMGATYQNGSLGQADDRSNGDRRSGQGEFIPLVTEYKTSFFKALYTKHADFRAAVKRQYNQYSSVFDSLPGVIDQMSGSIAASALMNHAKVNFIPDTLPYGPMGDNYKYETTTTLGSGQYVQTYLATNNTWANYVTNLKTYVTTRSLWFHEAFVQTCQHNYVETIVTQPTCTEEGLASYRCSICEDYYEVTLPPTGHNYEDGACTACGKLLPKATIVCDPGASVTVYETQTLSGSCVENAALAYPRNSKTGAFDDSGDGQINFVVVLEEGRQLDSVAAAPTESYKNLKGPDDTGVENGYRLTKVGGDLTITVNVRKFVTFDLNGHGENTPEMQIVNKGSTAAEPDPAPTASGYVFGGWYTNAACTGEAFDFANTPVTEDITLYAKWTEEGVDPSLKFAARSITLQNNLQVNYKVKKTVIDGGGYTDPYVVFRMNGIETTVTGALDSTNTYYVFVFRNIAPNKIHDTFTANLYATLDGELHKSATLSYSVSQYCYNQLNKITAQSELATLLVDLLNYGAQSQIYTGYNTGDLANAQLTTTQASWGTSTDPTYTTVQNTQYETVENPQVTWKALGLYLEDTVSIRLKLAVADTTGLTIKVRDDHGNEWNYGASALKAAEDDYYFYFPGLKADQMRETVYVAAYRGGTAVSNTVRYSIESYCYSKQSEPNEALNLLLKAMMKYGDSAYNYAN